MEQKLPPPAREQRINDPVYPLSEVKILEPYYQLRSLLPRMTPAAFMILFEFTFLEDANHTVCISIRKLAKKLDLHPDTVQDTIQWLVAEGWLAYRRGNAARSSVYSLNWRRIVEIRPADLVGSFPTSLSEISVQASVAATPGSSVFSDQGVGKLPTPPTENQQVTNVAGASISDPRVEPSGIDRLLSVKPQQFEKPRLDLAKSWMLSHQTKFGSPINIPPDDNIAAQLLQIGREASIGPDEWGRLEKWFRDLRDEQKKPGATWGWYVTVAAQRILGIKPETLSKRREELRNRKIGVGSEKNFRTSLTEGLTRGVRSL